jgi:hypothetical protein
MLEESSANDASSSNKDFELSSLKSSESNETFDFSAFFFPELDYPPN